jgi:hypothetical protein
MDDLSNSLITSQSARGHVFPILVSELVKESIMEKPDGELILKEFGKNHPAISAALDVYDQNSDMAGLVATLQQTVNTLRARF